jgi:putative long chain acyl-CoA synthase
VTTAIQKRKRSSLGGRLLASARNALELARFGRFGDDYTAPFDVVDRGEHHRLRQYATGAPANAPVALLVPPLMVTAEVYDIEAATSAVASLGAAASMS